MTAAGVQGVYPVAPGVALYGGVQLSGRMHQQSRNHVFNSTVSGLQAGVSLVKGLQLNRLGMDMTRVGLASQPYLNLSTLVGEWQYQHDHMCRATVQWSDQRYHSIDTYLDSDKPSG